MSAISDLQKCHSTGDLATLLGFKPSAVAYLIYKVPVSSRYTQYSIPKKSGGIRTIDAPSSALGGLQASLAKYLEKCRAELESKKKLPSLSHAFLPKRSIITNADKHKRRRFVLNIDLENFFPSINSGRVYGFFSKNRDFILPKKCAAAIAQIACVPHGLPQGSPCSPIISELVAHILDVRLAVLARSRGLTYSRYADDISFSTNQKEFPTDIAQISSIGSSHWVLQPALTNVISRSGFRINSSKTRMQLRAGRQSVTGLTVNAKINIDAAYYRLTRAMCESTFRTGQYSYDAGVGIAASTSAPGFPTAVISGSAPSPPGGAFPALSPPVVPSTPPPVGSGAMGSRLTKVTTANLDTLHGRLAYIYHIKEKIYLTKDNSKKKKEQGSEKKESSVRKLYRKFLRYKFFINPEMPIIIGEGKTDSVYIKCALRSLASRYPNLVSVTASAVRRRIIVFSYTNLIHSVMDLGGGTGGLAALIGEYKSILKSINHKPLKHPVIIIIDSDSGSKSVLSAINKNFGMSINLASMPMSLRIHQNLYVVRTPLAAGIFESCMEDMFDALTLSEVVDGRRFSKENEHDTSTHYGKNTFAERVVKKNAGRIDFSGFSDILDEVSNIVNKYSP